MVYRWKEVDRLVEDLSHIGYQAHEIGKRIKELYYEEWSSSIDDHITLKRLTDKNQLALKIIKACKEHIPPEDILNVRIIAFINSFEED